MTRAAQHGQGSYSAGEWRRRVKVARLKVEIDGKLGRTTPAWIRELAGQPVPALEDPVGRGYAGWLRARHSPDPPPISGSASP